MKLVPFWKEFNARASYVWVVGLTNPIFVTIYVMFFHDSHGGLQFLTVGFLITAIICVIAGILMALVIKAERRGRMEEMKRISMWRDAMPYNPIEAARFKAEAR